MQSNGIYPQVTDLPTQGAERKFHDGQLHDRSRTGLTAPRPEKSAMLNSHRKRLVPLTATLGAIIAYGLLGTGTGTASAGTNGQHINYHSNYTGAQCTKGTNQNSQSAQFCSLLRRGDNRDYGHWWVGAVTITWQRYSDDGIASSTCNVPQSQDGNFVTCNEPS